MAVADSHVQRELPIFEKFVAVCRLPIVRDSISPCRPPAPDIRCALANGDGLAFELVEIVDRDHAQRLSSQLTLPEYYYQRFTAASEGLRSALAERLGNAYVDLSFTRGSTVRQQKRAANELLRCLAGVDPKFEGDLDPTDLGLSGETVLRRVSIARGDFVGPWFESPTSGSFGDPAIELIGTKFSKTYVADVPIELLAYYNIQPLAADPRVPAELAAYVERFLPASPFRRVWLFFVASGLLHEFPRAYA